MGLFSSDDISIPVSAVHPVLAAMFDISSKPDLDLDEIRRQMDTMIEKQNKKMKNLSLNDKYKLDDSKEFFAKLDKDKK